MLQKLRYSTESKYRKDNEGYGFLSFARTFGDRYCKILIDTATKTGVNATKNISKIALQKTAEATGDLTGNKTADTINSAGKTKIQ